MNFEDFFNIIAEFGVDDVDITDLLKMEVEFCTKNRDGLTLLSIYECDGKIYIDIGDENE